jgi:hypothetical protein
MPAEQEERTIREAVGVFDSPDKLQAAIDDLMSSGFDRAELSLLAAEETVDKKARPQVSQDRRTRRRSDRSALLLHVDRVDRRGGLIGGLMYIGATAAAGAVVASVGTLALVIAAAALAGGVGGLFGSLLAKSVGDHHARYLQEQLDHGGLLLWVRTRTAEHEQRATRILSGHSGRDVHVHTLPIPR